MSVSAVAPAPVSSKNVFEAAAAGWNTVKTTAQFGMIAIGISEAIQLAGAWEYANIGYWQKPIAFTLVGTVATAALFVGALATAALADTNRDHYLAEAKRNAGV